MSLPLQLGFPSSAITNGVLIHNTSFCLFLINWSNTFFVGESTMFIGCIPMQKKLAYQTKCVFRLSDSTLKVCPAPSSKTAISLLRTSLACKDSMKNRLRIAPILLIFKYVKIYSLLMNPPCT
jgi:hypothetical protein